MRVVVVAESYLPYVSGVTVSTETLARGLGARGHAVLVIAPRPAHGAEPGTAGAPGPDPLIAWLPSYQLPAGAPRGYRMPLPVSTRRLAAAVAFAPDIVHVQSPFVAGRLGLRLARRAGVPLVFTHHTRFGAYGHYLGPFGAATGAVLDGYLRRFWARCDAIVAPAADLAAEIAAAIGPTAGTIVRAIPTGIDVAAIRAIDAVDPRVAAGWPASAVVVAQLGRLAAEKSVDIVIDAVEVAVREEPRLRLALIGDGAARAALELRAARALGDGAWFAGARPHQDALALLRGADLFAFASRTETQGLVLAEALGCGIPALAIDGPGVRDTIRDGVDGIVVARGAAAASQLGAALAALGADDDARRAMARAAVDGAGRFDVAVRIGQIEALYHELRSRGRARL